MWFRKAIDRGIKSGIEKALAPENLNPLIDKIVMEELRKPEYAWFRFVKMIQAYLHRADPAISGKEGFEMARSIYIDFLRSEGVKFGDPAYGWGPDDAKALVDEEVQHWEARAA